MVNYAEISDATDGNGDAVTDVDSTPDDTNGNDAGGNPDGNSDDSTNGDGTGTPGDDDATTDEDDHDPEVIEVLGCEYPELTAGNTDCNGTTYEVTFYTSAGTTVTASAGTVAGNEVVGIPIGTDVILTAFTTAGCETTLTVEGPNTCPDNCEYPELTLGQPICEGIGSDP